MARREQAAAEDHRSAGGARRLGPGQAEPPHGGERHHGDLLGQPLEQPSRHRVTRRGGLEEHGRQADQFRLGDAAHVDGDGDVADRRQAEIRGRALPQRGVLAAAVLGAHRPPHDLLAEVVATPPVAGEPSEREEPGGPPVRCQAHAVDAGAAGDSHAPRGLAGGRGEAGPQHGERVVGDGRGQRPALAAQRRRELLLFLGQVGAGQAARRVPGDQSAGCHACLRGHVGDDLAEYPHRAFDADVLLVGAGPAARGEQGAVRGDERDFCLAVPAVDGEHRRQRGPGISQGRPPGPPRARRAPRARTRAATRPCSRPRAQRKARRPRCPRTPRWSS